MFNRMIYESDPPDMDLIRQALAAGAVLAPPGQTMGHALIRWINLLTTTHQHAIPISHQGRMPANTVMRHLIMPPRHRRLARHPLRPHAQEANKVDRRHAGDAAGAGAVPNNLPP